MINKIQELTIPMMEAAIKAAKEWPSKYFCSVFYETPKCHKF